VGALSTAALGLHTLFDLFPLVFVLPALLAYTIEVSLVYLAIFALIAELFSTLPLGIMTLAVFLPWLLRRAWSKDPVDFSSSFFGHVLVSILAQCVVLFVPHLSHLPWTQAGALLPVVILVYIVSILVYYNRSW